MKPIILVFLSLLLAAQVYGQSLTGKVTKLDGTTGVSNVSVRLLDAAGNTAFVDTTGSDGVYSFEELPLGASYQMALNRVDANPIDGITVFDLFLIRNHIVGFTPLPSPLYLLAADMNSSQTISTFDLVIHRHYILGDLSAPGAPAAPRWHFARTLPGINDPSTPVSELVWPGTVTIADGEQVLDFTAVKSGDLNSSFTP